MEDEIAFERMAIPGEIMRYLRLVIASLSMYNAGTFSYITIHLCVVDVKVHFL